MYKFQSKALDPSGREEIQSSGVLTWVLKEDFSPPVKPFEKVRQVNYTCKFFPSYFYFVLHFGEIEGLKKQIRYESMTPRLQMLPLPTGNRPRAQVIMEEYINFNSRCAWTIHVQNCRHKTVQERVKLMPEPLGTPKQTTDTQP